MTSPLTQPPLVTLTTDFGAESHYVAQMKGVILSRCRSVQLVDISHGIPPQDIRHAAWVLQQTIGAFPDDTCHVAVVDPGVGTSRRLVLARIAEQWFLAPDNGLLDPLVQQHGLAWACELTARHYWAAHPSVTFHGRDILASVAGHLCGGVHAARFGPPVTELERLALPAVHALADGVRGEIVYIDSFGNLITNLQRDQLGQDPRAIEIELPRQERVWRGLSTTYADHPPGTPIALIGSNGQLEVAVVNGNAQQTLQAAVGDPIVVRAGLGSRALPQ